MYIPRGGGGGVGTGFGEITGGVHQEGGGGPAGLADQPIAEQECLL